MKNIERISSLTNSPNIIARSKYQYSIRNPDNKYNSKKVENSVKYTNRMLDYYSNIEKKATNLIDYYTGKINKNMDINLIKEDGKYASKEELEKRKKFIANQINSSNLWQVILSFDNNYIDKNISLEDLEQKIAKEVLPSFFKKMGFEDIKKMQYQLSLHTNTDNYHFHIAFLEKSPNTRDSNNKLSYRRMGKIPRKALNFLKKETALAIEREHEFKPRVIDINNEIEHLKSYFIKDSYNYVLKDKSSFMLEEKILNLGKLLNEKVISENNNIKFNSIKDKEIKILTKDIMKELFNKNSELKSSKDMFDEKIESLNNYFIKISRDNNISMKDIDYSYSNNKEKYLDNYILNSIVNYARYHYRNEKAKLKIKNTDIIQSIILNIYKDNKKTTRKNLVNNYYSNIKNNRFKLQRDVRSAIRNINNEMEEASNEFHKLFVNENEKSL